MASRSLPGGSSSALSFVALWIFLGPIMFATMMAIGSGLDSCGLHSFVGATPMRFTHPSVQRLMILPSQALSRNMEIDLLNAVAQAAYDIWAAEYPMAAQANNFLGQSVSKSDMAARVLALRDGLQLGWADVLGLVHTDSSVLFAGSKLQVSKVLAQIEEEVGSREAALQTLEKHPAILFASAAELMGKGSILRTVAELSDMTRSTLRIIHGAFYPIASLAAPWAVGGFLVLTAFAKASDGLQGH